MTMQVTQARSLYRRLLREMPARSPSILANPSPMHRQIRGDFDAASTDSSSKRGQLEEADQYVQYLKAQRVYTTLLERYNPGMDMNEEERVRLTARRVGVELPVDMQTGGASNKN